MLHTKFQGHQPFGSREDFLRFLPYMGMVVILVVWPGPSEQTFVPQSHGDSIWNLASIGPVVSENMFKSVWRMDRWRRPPYPISLPISLRFRWANDLCAQQTQISLGICQVLSVFAVLMKKHWVLSYPLSAQQRLIRLGGCPGWSESSLGAQVILLGFVLLQLTLLTFLSSQWPIVFSCRQQRLSKTAQMCRMISIC